MFGAILTTTNSSFQKGMTFCRSIYLKEVMKLLSLYLNSPRTLAKIVWVKFKLKKVLKKKTYIKGRITVNI